MSWMIGAFDLPKGAARAAGIKINTGPDDFVPIK